MYVQICRINVLWTFSCMSDVRTELSGTLCRYYSCMAIKIETISSYMDGYA